MSTEHSEAPHTDSALAPEVVRGLVDNHRRFLALVERRVGSRDLAEEILQDAFVRSLTRGGELREAESATAWFYRVLRNALVDHYRRDGARARALEAVQREPADHDDEDLEREACDCVAALVDALKPEYATALRRVDLGGLSLAELARSEGITANNATVRVHRARLALRKLVTRSCGTCATHGCVDCSCGSASTPGGG